MTKLLSFASFYLFLSLVAFIPVCRGQSNLGDTNASLKSVDQSKADLIHELMSTYAEYGKFEGAVLVTEKGKIIYKKGFGLANREWDIPNQTDTKFRLASVTKQFTAMLIMQLVSEGKLALDARISSYLPDYPKESGQIKQIPLNKR
jgi:CubicO group peptidase (beta-lactamase class C family)